MIRLALLTALLVPLTSQAQGASTSSMATRADSTIVCVASRPSATPLDTVELRVLADSGVDTRAYQWKATAGEIVTGAPTARWLFERAGLGVHTATARREGAPVSCSVKVVVVPPRGHMGGTLRARAYLPRDSVEESGYAVYSYLLLGAQPDTTSRGRFRAAVTEFVRLSEDIDAFHAAQRRDRGAFNMSYVPMTRPVQQPQVDSILKYYDYAAAQALLRKLPGQTMSGPYLVSVPRTPLSRLDSLPQLSLVQDLSTVPDDVVAPWVRRFLELATQQRFDDRASMQKFVLSLRTAIGVAALGISDVTDSLVKWKELFDKLVKVK